MIETHRFFKFFTIFFLLLHLALLADSRKEFWATQAGCIDWFKEWNTILQWEAPYAKWFVDGKLNASYNCLDRHIQGKNANKLALIWEGENHENKSFTFAELYTEVCKFSNVLKSLGVKKGDRVVIYLPMIPEAVVAMLSCARIGAIHTVVFGGFSAESLKDRIQDAEAKLIITADGGYRRGNIIALKTSVDLIIEQCPSIEKLIVVKRTNAEINMKPERDHWYHHLMQNTSPYCSSEVMDAEDKLFILYTSGTTGKPKGIVHTTGGYMVGVTKTMQWVFDLKPNDIYWCTADIGWITGHSYVVYRPLSNGTTIFIYEGAPDWPQRDRFWKLIEKYGITIFYTSPTAVRTFMKWGEEWLKDRNLSSLRILGSVGEPINPEAWNWYYSNIGNNKCPIIDTWWQTETGCIVISPLPGKTFLKPGSATFPLPGFDVAIVDEAGKPTANGYLVITSPWPSMLRGIYNDDKKYSETYWSKWDGRFYFTGDGAKQDEEGYYWLQGRIDDVMNVSGHRISTIEIENALIDCKCVAESACVGVAHPIKGQAILSFVSLKEGFNFDNTLEETIKQHVVHKIGAFARPEKIIFICELPKTRSGKIMRRLLRDIAEGRVLGDLSTLADPSVVNEIKSKYQEE